MPLPFFFKPILSCEKNERKIILKLNENTCLPQIKKSLICMSQKRKGNLRDKILKEGRNSLKTKILFNKRFYSH